MEGVETETMAVATEEDLVADSAVDLAAVALKNTTEVEAVDSAVVSAEDSAVATEEDFMTIMAAAVVEDLEAVTEAVAADKF